MVTEGSFSSELGSQEENITTPNPNRLLFTSELRKILNKSVDKTAFNHSVAMTMSLLSQAKNTRTSIVTIAKALDGVDFNDKNLFSEHGHSVQEESQNDLKTRLGIELTEQEMGISFRSSLDNAIAIAGQLIDRTENTFFHGTNSVAIEGIQKNGLTRGVKGYEPDIESILDITRSIGGSEQLFGWYKLNSLGKIFLTGDTYGALKYAEGSPEWFDQFTSKWNPNQPFRHRDYDEAKRYLEERIQRWSNRSPEEIAYGRRGLAPEEAERFRAFFEKYWYIFGSAEPVIVQVNSSDATGLSSLANLASVIQIQKNLHPSSFYIEEGDERARKFVEKHGSIEDVKNAIKFINGQHAYQKDIRVEDEDLQPDKLSFQVVPKFQK